MKKISSFLITLLSVISIIGVFSYQADIDTDIEVHLVKMDDEVKRVVDGELLPYVVPNLENGERFIGWFTEDDSVFDFSTPIKKDFNLRSKKENINAVFAGRTEMYLEAKTNGLVANATMTGEYLEDRVKLYIDVVDSNLSTSHADKGMRDNVEITLQSRPTDKYHVDYTINFLANPNGDYWIKRAAGPTNFSADAATTTQLVRGYNFDFVTTLTEVGYNVEVYFTYEVLKTNKEKALNSVIVDLSMRNTNGSQTEWFQYIDNGCLWGQPLSFLTLGEDGLFFRKMYEPKSIEKEFELFAKSKYPSLELLDSLATIENIGLTEVKQLKEGAPIFLDRTYRFDTYRMPQELIGLSFLYGGIDGSKGVVTEAGFVVLIAPSSKYPELNYNLKKAEFIKIISEDINIGSGTPGGNPIEELTDYYIKWCEVGEQLNFGKWCIPVFKSISSYEEYSWLIEKANISRDFTNREEINRFWQGVPGMETTTNGRIFAGWVTGGDGEPRIGNYLVTVYSDDNGETWNNLFIVEASTSDSRVNDVQFWQQPDGKLAIYYCQGKNGSNFDGFTGVWQVTIDNPDDEPDEFIMDEPRRLFDGLMRNKPIVLNDGTWLATPNLYSNDDYTIVYESHDLGATWQVRGMAYIPNARTFDETVLVEKLDGTLWMTVRTTTGQIIECYSFDKGKTWGECQKTNIINPAARFQIVRLSSGNLLLINNASTSRNNLTAYLSYDDGLTWSDSMLIDAGTSTYPDVRQTADGYIHLVWDRDRVSANAKILYTKFSENDILTLSALPNSRIKVVSDLNRALSITTGQLLGDNAIGTTTSGYDLTNDLGDTPSAVQKGSGDQYAFIKDIVESDFYFEADVTAHSVFINDSYPKFGIVVKSQSSELFYYIDGQKSPYPEFLNCRTVGYVLKSTSTSWQWDSASANKEVRADIRYTDSNVVKMGIAKIDGTFYFFVNGYIVMEANDFSGFEADVSLSVGFLTFNTKVTFKNYQLTENPTDISTAVSSKLSAENLFIGDSYIDTDHFETFYQKYSTPSNINIGVGGTRVQYWIDNIDVLVAKYAPANIFINVGINDINAGTSGAAVGLFLVDLFNTIHSRFPSTTIYFISICPSVSNWSRWNQSVIANQAVKDYLKVNDFVTYIDLASKLLDENDNVNDVFYSDCLNLNKLGYSKLEELLDYYL